MLFIDGIVTLNSIDRREEAEAYVKFLRLEQTRHRRARAYAASVARDKASAAQRFCAEAQFWCSAVERHDEDIEGTAKRIQKVCEQWGLPMKGECEPPNLNSTTATFDIEDVEIQ